jgi:hypothetical protein
MQKKFTGDQLWYDWFGRQVLDHQQFAQTTFNTTATGTSDPVAVASA